MSIFDRRYETMPQPERRQLQLERLQALLVRLRKGVRRYREKLGDIKVPALEDLSQLPMTNPEELASSFPYGMFALPLREVIRLHSLVGPEGRPLVIGHTRNDLQQWGRLVARQLAAAGVTANDVIQVCLGGGVVRGVSGYGLGAELIEASVIAEDPFHVDYQLAMLQNYRPTVLITTPTNAFEIMRIMEERRVDTQSLHLRTVLLSRPVSAEVREQLRAGLFAAVQCNFGVGEILDPGFSVECDQGRFHVNEDQFLVEIDRGELVVTTLGREAIPLLRFRTRIACELNSEKCPCGRTSVTLVPGSRLDGRLRVNETPLYESQIAEVLKQTRIAGHPFRVQVHDQRVTLFVEMTEDLLADTMWPIVGLQRQLQSEFLARLGVEAEVRFVEHHLTAV
jgi:phenylacetate-CoA ligase